MNRISSTIVNVQANNQKSLVGYFMAGEFGIDETTQIMHKSVEAGLDILELGFPFSDPTADGETIQKSAQTAIQNGIKVSDIFRITARFRNNNNDTPIILMGYFNIVFQYGLKNFAKQCNECGVDGVIIIDLPIEESSIFERILKKYDIYLIQVVSFLTSPERFNKIQKHAKGFVYLISTFGVTGNSQPMVEMVAQYITNTKSSIPLFVGFGINSPQSARDISKKCDGIIVGSHFIKQLHNGGVEQLVKSIREIKSAI